MKRIILGTMLMLMTVGLFAQPQKEKIESMKIAFISKELSLTSKEAKAFWPIYNEYQAVSQKIKKTLRTSKRNIADKSDKELEAIINQRFQLQQQLLDIEKKYYQKLKKVIPIRKVVKLQQAEQNFKRQLLEMSRRGRNPRNRK